jgi:hypothetical protein
MYSALGLTGGLAITAQAGDLILSSTSGSVRGQTPSAGDNSTKLATTAFVNTAMASGPVTPVSYYGVSGSSSTTTGTISASSTSLSLASAIDFANGQGIAIWGAGATLTAAQPSGASIVQNGATGATNYAYKISSLDASGGIGLPITATIANGNATLNLVNNVTITFTPGSGAVAEAVWKSTNSGAYVFVGTVVGGTFVDGGFTPWWRPAFIPATPPGSAQNDWLVTKVSSGGGTTTLTLANAAINGVSGATVQHDDTSNINYAITQNANGATIYFPCGTFNITSAITVAQGNTVLTGSGRCSIINAYGLLHDFYFNGGSSGISSQGQGNGVVDFLVQSYNKIGGQEIYATFQQYFSMINVIADHPYGGPWFHNSQDVRVDHNRWTYFWGYGNQMFRIDSDATYNSCCFAMYDDYGTGIANLAGINSTVIGNGRSGAAYGYVIDGNVATIVSYDVAVSDPEGKGWSIINDTGNATNPQFIQCKDCASEFSTDIGIYFSAGSDFYFTDTAVHAAETGNDDIYIGANTHIVNFTGGRIDNAGGNCIEIAGYDVSITGAAILNCSAPNAGGTSATSSGIAIDSTAYVLSISGNRIGQDFGVGWVNAYPININSGANHWTITGNTFYNNNNNTPNNPGGTNGSKVLGNNAS